AAADLDPDDVPEDPRRDDLAPAPDRVPDPAREAPPSPAALDVRFHAGRADPEDPELVAADLGRDAPEEPCWVRSCTLRRVGLLSPDPPDPDPRPSATTALSCRWSAPGPRPVAPQYARRC